MEPRLKVNVLNFRKRSIYRFCHAQYRNPFHFNPPSVVAQPLSFDVWQAPITPISLLQMNEITLAVETVSLKRVCFAFEL